MKNQKIKLNWPLVGNGHIIDYLEKVLVDSKSDNSTMSHTFIFSGQKDLGKGTIANYFAKSLLCEQRSKSAQLPCDDCSTCRQFVINNEQDEQNSLHSDLFIVKKDEDKKNISIEQIREFIRHLSLSSFLNSYKIGIIKDAETLSEEAANSLLKTAEEPRNKVVIILLTTDLESLPSTIVSRSQVLRFHPVEPGTIQDFLIKEQKASRSAAKNAAHLALGRPALALKFLRDKDFNENYLKIARSFLEIARKDINDRLEIVELLIGSRAIGQAAANKAVAILEIWQAILRDLLLISNNQTDIIQHAVIQSDLNIAKNRFRVSDLVNISRNLENTKKYIMANVNPKIALENLLLII